MVKILKFLRKLKAVAWISGSGHLSFAALLWNTVSVAASQSRQHSSQRPNGSHRQVGSRSSRLRHGPASSIMSSDIETTSFVDSDDENSTRYLAISCYVRCKRWLWELIICYYLKQHVLIIQLQSSMGNSSRVLLPRCM